MKSHHTVICVAIFVLCWLVFGFRGVDAGIVGVVCYLVGLRVERKEQAVADGIERLKGKLTGWWAS